MEDVLQIVREKCLSGDCLYGKDASYVDKLLKEKCCLMEVLENILTILKKLHLMEELKSHFPCVLIVLQRMSNLIFQFTKVYKMDYISSTSQKQLSSIAIIVCALPDVCYPLKLKHDSDSDQEFDMNHQLNPKLTKQCLNYYCQLLYLGTKENSESTIDHLQKHKIWMVKQSCWQLLSLVSSRLGKFSWTDAELQEICNKTINLLCRITGHKNISELLAGTTSDERIVLHGGVFGRFLDHLSLVFTKSNWRKNLPWKHSLIWCITKIKYPNLREHVTKIVPFLLLMVDDYVKENKMFGITTLLYLLNNVNASDMNLYGHGKVIYEALFSQLYSGDANIFELTLPCLNKVLTFVEPDCNTSNSFSWTLWDETVEKIIQNIECSSNIQTRQVLLKFFPLFVENMGINFVKHTNNIFKSLQFVLLFPDHDEEKSRFYALQVFHKTIKHTWPIIKRYQVSLLKTHIKLFLDISSMESICPILERKFEEHIMENLLLLRACCGQEFDALLCDTNQLYVKEPSSVIALKNLLKKVAQIDTNVHTF